MGQEKERISERLERLDAEREKLSAQLNELEIAERVLARFGGKAVTTEKRGRARPAKTAPAVGEERRARANQQVLGVSLSDATLKAVQANNAGATPREVLDSLAERLGREREKPIQKTDCPVGNGQQVIECGRGRRQQIRGLVAPSIASRPRALQRQAESRHNRERPSTTLSLNCFKRQRRNIEKTGLRAHDSLSNCVVRTPFRTRLTASGESSSSGRKPMSSD
jgi:hypothetical protein